VSSETLPRLLWYIQNGSFSPVEISASVVASAENLIWEKEFTVNKIRKTEKKFLSIN